MLVPETGYRSSMFKINFKIKIINLRKTENDVHTL